MRRISCNARFDLDLCVGLNLAAHDCYKNEEGQRGKIADRANIFPVGFPGLVRTVYEVGGFLLPFAAAAWGRLAGQAGPGVSSHRAPSISRRCQTRAAKALTGGTQQFRQITASKPLKASLCLGEHF